ncbi:sensor histidine kinase [Sphingomonas bacterium]|uniref:sensor histidine kinase n=1 Tax=Sphingomonas bacterium TaxID=1895847 RepID=UPI0015777107|nr:HAMP domain-containing sensor histidine kinase [Sphingomonas bacterium]
MIDRGTVRGLIDQEGRLASADEALLALNARAGGAIGEPLAVNPIATLARLAGRLGVLISRGVTVADEVADLDLWIRAQPVEGGAVALTIGDWRERQPWRQLLRPAADRPAPLPDGGDDRWETDAAMRLTALSPEAGGRFGLDVAGLLGRPFTQAFRLAEGADGDLPVIAALAQRQGFAGQRATIRGSDRPVLIAATARLDPGGAFAGFVGTIAVDPDAAEAATLTQAFSARLDTVLRAPLGIIVANADSIHAQADGPLRADYVDYAADIASAGRHLIALVDDLADLQAIERPDFVVAADAIDLADVARRAGGLLGVRASDAGVRIDRPMPDDTLPTTGEFRRALQVMVNLVGNAVRYSPEGGTVWIRTEREGANAIVVVADQGKGIAAQDQARIFDKFERVDRSEPGGSGIGLYVARRLARAMGGDLTVDSAPEQGARFVFSLPAR